eukprot:11467210-Alexandrium_andersonii.AAC.1
MKRRQQRHERLALGIAARDAEDPRAHAVLGAGCPWMYGASRSGGTRAPLGALALLWPRRLPRPTRRFKHLDRFHWRAESTGPSLEPANVLGRVLDCERHCHCTASARFR